MRRANTVVLVSMVAAASAGSVGGCQDPSTSPSDRAPTRSATSSSNGSFDGVAGDDGAIAPLPIPAGCQTNGAPGGDTHVDFPAMRAILVAAKPAITARQQRLLSDRYDLSDHPSPTVTMFRGKAVQTGVRVKLPPGQTWDTLAALTPDQIKAGGLWPAGFLGLPHPKHEEGGMVFPKTSIDEIKKQTSRDLTRFDVDFDLPDRFLPEFPPPIFLTDRPDLGDVSQGQLLTTDNFYELLKNVLNAKQLDGFRLLLTPFPQQQFNVIDDRRSDRPSLGVACFDCHVNGHTFGATHTVQDARPNAFRHRVSTTSLRGVAFQRLFGSQRALKSVEDFTDFEQRTAYFDGDVAAAAKKGMNPLDFGLQVSEMGEVQNLLDFPPAPKLAVDGTLDPSLATAAELRGEAIFHGKARCAECHAPPYYTDNDMHDLHLERFFTPLVANCAAETAEGPIKTFVLRGIKESPPYLHDDRLPTLEDTIELFNLVLGTRLTAAEKADLLAFLYVL